MIRYSSAEKAAWDGFVRASKNGTFLLLRDYMDYHSDRFKDHSLLVHDHGRLLAVLPANEDHEGLVSHAGLTYGGIVCDASMTTSRMLRIFDALFGYLREHGVGRLLYKTIPTIYHLIPAEEDRYALFHLGARLCRRDVLSVIANDSRLPYKEDRRRALSKARRHGLHVERSNDLAAFWAILEERLHQGHGVKPTHTLEEMKLLHARFPDSIRLHLCREDNDIVAGELIYDTACVAHGQYGVATARGKEIGAQDFLLAQLIEVEYAHRRFFDFGTSNYDGGRRLNLGLLQQKEGFGARTVVHDFYELGLSGEFRGG